MKHLIWALAVIFLLVVQAGILVPFQINLANLILLILVISLLFASFDFTIFLCLFAGICLDIVSGNSGVTLITLTTVFLLMYFIINRVVDREPNLLILFFAVAGGTVGYFGIFWIVNGIFGLFTSNLTLDIEHFFLQDLVKALILNLIFTYPIFRFYFLVENLSNNYKKYDPRSIRI